MKSCSSRADHKYSISPFLITRGEIEEVLKPNADWIYNELTTDLLLLMTFKNVIYFCVRNMIV